MTNTSIFKLIRKEVIKTNGKKTDPNYILNEGDEIKIYLQDSHFEDIKPDPDKYKSVKINIDIVFEDNNILVVNKPTGLKVHPDKTDYKNVLSEMVKAYLYKKNEYKPDSLFSPAPCNRLDTNTSGLVVFAKNHESLKSITGEFRKRLSEKYYLAFVFGKISKNLLITSIIDTKENRENVVSMKSLKIITNIPAKSDFFMENKDLSATLIKPVKIIDNSTLCEIELWTGKKHQIRAHLKSAGFPLLGENKYFTPASMTQSKIFGLNNYLLHAYKMKINGYDEFTAPIPSVFTKTVGDIF